MFDAIRAWLSTLYTQRALDAAAKTPPTKPERFGQVALSIARGEIGNGEEGANNRGPDLDRYRFGVTNTGAWCAWFISYCLAMAALKLGRPLPFERTGGAKSLARAAGKVGFVVPVGHLPEPGDLVLFERGLDGDWKGHIGIVESADESGYVSIEGNVGAYPSKVKRRTHRYGADRFLRFVRV